MRRIIYIVPAHLLHCSSIALRPAEKVQFVTGVRISKGIIVLTGIVPVQFQASTTHAVPDPADQYQQHSLVQHFGMEIDAQFHSHPGTGPDATWSSATDLATAARWEKHDAFLGAIFSNCGRFVRFFNANQESEIDVYGDNVTRISSRLFEIHPYQDEDGPVSTEPGPAEGTDGSPGKAFVVEPVDDRDEPDPTDRSRGPRRANGEDAGADGRED